MRPGLTDNLKSFVSYILIKFKETETSKCPKVLRPISPKSDQTFFSRFFFSQWFLGEEVGTFQHTNKIEVLFFILVPDIKRGGVGCRIVVLTERDSVVHLILQLKIDIYIETTVYVHDTFSRVHRY